MFSTTTRLRDYQAGKNDLAAQEFADYVKYYPNTDLAGNSNFYLADIQFRQGNYQAAAKSYDQVLQSFPDGNKAASAELKKGLSLIELGQQEAGIASLRHVIQRYPKSNEAATGTGSSAQARSSGLPGRPRDESSSGLPPHRP